MRATLSALWHPESVLLGVGAAVSGAHGNCRIAEVRCVAEVEGPPLPAAAQYDTTRLLLQCTAQTRVPTPLPTPPLSSSVSSAGMPTPPASPTPTATQDDLSGYGHRIQRCHNLISVVESPDISNLVQEMAQQLPDEVDHSLLLSLAEACLCPSHRTRGPQDAAAIIYRWTALLQAEARRIRERRSLALDDGEPTRAHRNDATYANVPATAANKRETGHADPRQHRTQALLIVRRSGAAGLAILDADDKFFPSFDTTCVDEEPTPRAPVQAACTVASTEPIFEEQNKDSTEVEEETEHRGRSRMPRSSPATAALLQQMEAKPAAWSHPRPDDQSAGRRSPPEWTASPEINVATRTVRRPTLPSPASPLALDCSTLAPLLSVTTQRVPNTPGTATQLPRLATDHLDRSGSSPSPESAASPSSGGKGAAFSPTVSVASSCSSRCTCGGGLLDVTARDAAVRSLAMAVQSVAAVDRKDDGIVRSGEGAEADAGLEDGDWGAGNGVKNHSYDSVGGHIGGAGSPLPQLDLGQQQSCPSPPRLVILAGVSIAVGIALLGALALARLVDSIYM